MDAPAPAPSDRSHVEICFALAHVPAPSVETRTPSVVAANSRSPSFGSTSRLKKKVLTTPSASFRDQVVPPSVDMSRPSPGISFVFPSPVPAYAFAGSDGSKTRAPIPNGS